MRKHTFLIATAVAALTLGSGAAFGQQSEKATPGGGAGAAPSHNAAPSNRAGQSQGGEHNRMGQSEHKSGQTTGQGSSGEHNRMGQSEKRDRSTTGQAPNEQQPGMQKGSQKSSEHEGNKAQKPNEKAQKPNERNRTTGQGANERNERNANERNERNRGTTGQGVNERSNTKANERNNTNVNEHNGTSTRSGSHTSVNLTSEQRTKIHTIIVGQRSAPRVAHVDFDVRVGTRVPRGKVHLAAIPSTIIDIQPAWRGFEYFLVGNEIVVVDPSSLEIVAVLPA